MSIVKRVNCVVPTILAAAFLACLLSCSSRSSSPANNDAVPAQSSPGHLARKSGPRETSKLMGLVVAVVDGDTVTVLDEHNSYSIRLQGIDAPEKRQDFSNVSRRNLANLVAGKQVMIEYEKHDQHKRIVGKVLVDGTDICLEQIKAGLAWHYKQYQNEQTESDRVLYTHAEEQAKTAKRGLWQYQSPTPPWDFRHSKNTSKPTADPTTISTTASITADANVAPIVGNKRSMIYHWPACPYYDAIAPNNRVVFRSREEAEKAGYRPAGNCP